MGALIFTGFLETKIYLLFNIQFSVMLCQSGHFGKKYVLLGIEKGFESYVVIYYILVSCSEEVH